MPRPSTLTIWERPKPRCELSPIGGRSVSKFRRRRASRAAAGVLPPAGVRFHDPLACAGLGVILRKSAKLILVEGVFRPKPGNAAPPPGVDIMDDGRGVAFGGGVDGAMKRGLADSGRAGDGGQVHEQVGITIPMVSISSSGSSIETAVAEAGGASDGRRWRTGRPGRRGTHVRAGELKRRNGQIFVIFFG
jgi:hypothetical protein